MTPTPRLVPDRPSDAAIAQAFYGAMQLSAERAPQYQVAYNFIIDNAAKIDAAAPAAVAHPSRGVVDEAMVDRACSAAYGWWKYPENQIERPRLRSQMRAALQAAAALPAVPDGFCALAERALPFIHDEAKNSSANLAFDGGVEVSPCPHSWADNCDCFAATPAQEAKE